MAERDHLPNQLIDRLLAEAASEPEQTRVAEHLESCPQCAAKLRQAEEAREAFLQRNPPELRVSQLLEKPPSHRARRLLVPAFAATAALAVVIIVWISRPSGDQRPEILTKGSAPVSFSVHRASTGEIWEGESGDTFRPGDAVQLKVDPPADMTHLSVFSMDYLGKPTHLLSLRASGPRSLPHSLILDDSPDPERIFVVFSKAPIGQKIVGQSAARAFEIVGGDIKSLESFEIRTDSDAIVRSILIKKEKPPTSKPSDVTPGK